MTEDQNPYRRIETGSANVPPPPVQSGRPWGRWVLIGAGGYLMLILLSVFVFVGCLAAIGGGGGEDVGTSGGELSYEDARAQAVSVGDTVQAGNVSWTVTNVQRATELKSFGQTKQGNFILVDITFVNNGDEPVTLDSNSLAILDSQGRTHETDPDAPLYVPENMDLFLNQVNPGVSQQGRAVFNVAPDAQGLILRAGDANLFSDDNAYVRLGV
jgi:hypothetical protein